MFTNFFQYYVHKNKYKLLKKKKFGKIKQKKSNNFKIFTFSNIFIIIILLLFLFSFVFYKTINKNSRIDNNNIIINNDINTNINHDKNINNITINNINTSKFNSSPEIKSFSFSASIPQNIQKKNIISKLINYSFSYSEIFEIVEIKYFIGFYDENNILMIPSDLLFYYNLHIFCHMESIDFSNYVNSFSNIYENKYYYCIEYIKKKQYFKSGIRIYQSGTSLDLTYYFITDNIIDYKNITNLNENKFNQSLLKEQYDILINEIRTYNNNTQNMIDKKLLLKRSYIKNPIFKTKLDCNNNNQWIFENIYNNYFCFCKGSDCHNNWHSNSYQRCKYNFYLTIIDNNRYIYNKTDHMLADFFETYLSADDAYPIFKQMLEQNISAYYMTKRNDIYSQYCNPNEKCKLIIKDTTINGDFLEKYLDIILRLKTVISGGGFYSMDNLFYNIEYITSICLTHGIDYFKPRLYDNYYGPQNYNKIVTSTSNKIISLALKHGWKEENIIKICFPKWDNYDIYDKSNLYRDKNNTSIFIFFTWRNLKNKKVSHDYFINIVNLINNDALYQELINNNINLYYNIHHMFGRYSSHVKIIKNKIIPINYIQISDCLKKASLLVTDFSSVIFDIMYQRKPGILYIPDANDPNIENYYDYDYYNIINSIKNGSYYFENKFFNIDDAVNKIIYYIRNNFELESDIKDFYDSFEFNCGKNITSKFINYVLD